ncbi:MAG TPA: sulfite exporter TauE/SafE family protein [Spirochaetota bacterium]|nr:sulfite exporter TauE/SafE family protein [Spirochaetota bacterium]
MITNINWEMGLIIIFIALAAEYIDSTLGMGYGTTLTPLLLLLNYRPLQVVPAVLLSELITGVLGGIIHHSAGNVNIKPKTLNPARIIRAVMNHGPIHAYKNGLPKHLKIALLLASCSVIGTVLSVFIALNIPKFYLKLYIGILILIIGLIIIFTIKKNFSFSWKRVTFLGLIASFNKGLSGGGYGPLVTGGQLLAGINSKNAIGITALAEGLTCLVGVIMYITGTRQIDWCLAPYLAVGAVLSVPLSAISVKKICSLNLKKIIGLLTISLGTLTLLKIIL